jgi:hypothetical protein
LIVNDAGTPTLGGVDGGVMVIAGADATLTVTDAEAWPEFVGVVGVVGVPGVVGVVGVVGAVAPTLAVTVAC